MTLPLPHRYSAYGLTFLSDFVLPELPPAPETSASPCVSILRTLSLPPAGEAAVEFADHGNRQILQWQAVGRFVIAADNRIEVSPAAGAGDDLIALPLLGTVLATLLQRRGLFVLHASAVAGNGAAAGLLGDKGAGKSTTAATLIGAGCRLLADDVLAIDFAAPGAPLVLPGFARLKLWRDTADHFGPDPRDAHPLPAVDKASYGMADQFQATPVPLRRLYLLSRGSEVRIEVPDPADAIGTLLRFAYLARFGETGFGSHLRNYFARAGSLGASDIVRRVILPQGLDRLTAGIRTLQRDFATPDRQ